MALFGRKNEGGLMDVIRCDQDNDYIIWKWSPSNCPSKKENAIRYGSSLRVKDGEVAVFVYKQSNGVMQDFIEGPYDQTIKTDNFPILTSIVGSAFGGSSPFQAEIYFINLAGVIKLPLFIDNLKISSNIQNYTLPARVSGSIIFNISDYRNFIKLHKLRELFVDELKSLLREPLGTEIGSIIGQAPRKYNLPVFELDTNKKELSTLILTELKNSIEFIYGINLMQVNVSEISFDEESSDYSRVDKILRARAEHLADEQFAAATRDVEDKRNIANANLADTLAAQVSETQHAQRMQTDTNYFGVHQLNVQGDVAKTAAESLGQLSGGGAAEMGGAGFNPAGMVTGMMMGGAVGSSMTNLMGGMMNNLNQPQPPPPPTGSIAQYHIAVNGRQSGPYTIAQLQQFVNQGELTPGTYLWKQGMAAWNTAAEIPEIAGLFGTIPPPLPL